MYIFNSGILKFSGRTCTWTYMAFIWHFKILFKRGVILARARSNSPPCVNCSLEAYWKVLHLIATVETTPLP